MAENPLSVLAIACSLAALVCSLVVMIRSTPQRVRTAAYTAVEISEQTQSALSAAVNRMITFQDEVTREREAAADDLAEAERKRRQAAAKLSAVAKKTPQESEQEPTTLAEALAQYPQGDPRRMVLLRSSRSMAGGE